MVQQMLDNPQMFEAMFMNNPQIQRIIEQNPEVGHMLRDPQLMRQSLEV